MHGISDIEKWGFKINKFGENINVFGYAKKGKKRFVESLHYLPQQIMLA